MTDDKAKAETNAYDNAYHPTVRLHTHNLAHSLSVYLHATIEAWRVEHGTGLLAIIGALEMLGTGYCSAARAINIDHDVLHAFRKRMRAKCGKTYWEDTLQPLLKEGIEQAKADSAKARDDTEAINDAVSEGRTVGWGVA